MRVLAKVCRTVAILLAALPFRAGFIHAQVAPESQEQHAPTLTVTTRIVVLDVMVTDKKGNPVHRDLTSDDFTIYEDKQPQRTRSFEKPDQHQMPRGTTEIVNAAVDLKKIGDAPVTILVLDELNSRFEDISFSRQMLVKYLQSQPKVLPQSTVLMIASNSTFQQMHDYTQDRDALIEVVKKHNRSTPGG